MANLKNNSNVVNLGCRLNSYESEVIANILEKAHFYKSNHSLNHPSIDIGKMYCAHIFGKSSFLDNIF